MTTFNKSNTSTYKVVVTWTSGKSADFPFITAIEYPDNGTIVLHGQNQTDGTMENRSYVLERRVVAFADVRRISTVRTMQQNTQMVDSYVGDSGEPAF
jgi:ABC-type branched-subunit amino acid transport system ATPase component